MNEKNINHKKIEKNDNAEKCKDIIYKLLSQIDLFIHSLLIYYSAYTVNKINYFLIKIIKFKDYYMYMYPNDIVNYHDKIIKFINNSYIYQRQNHFFKK